MQAVIPRFLFGFRVQSAKNLDETIGLRQICRKGMSRVALSCVLQGLLLRIAGQNEAYYMMSIYFGRALFAIGG